MALEKENNSISKDTMSAIFIIVTVSAYILINFFAGFILPIYLVVMSIAFLISLANPKGGIFAIVFLTMVFERFFTLSSLYIGTAEYKIFPIDIILLGVIAGIIFQFISGRRKGIKLKIPDKFLLVFILINILYFFTSFFISNASTYLAFSSLKNYVFYSLTYFIILFLFENKTDIRRFFKFFFAGGIAIIFFIFFGILNGEGLWTEFTPLSTSGVRILAFTHGLYLSLLIIPALLFSIYKKNSLVKKAITFLLLIWIVGIVGSMMRHLWVAVGIAFIFVYFFQLHPKKNQLKDKIGKVIIPAVACLSFLLYAAIIFPDSSFNQKLHQTSASVFERGASIANANQDDSFLWRKIVWNGAFGEYEKSPFWGIGTGKKIYVENNDYKDYVEVRNIHNSYLAIFMQLGVPGLAIFTLVIFSSIKSILKSKPGEDDGEFIKYSLVSVIIVFLVVLCFQPYLETNLLSIFFWMSLGLARIISGDNFQKAI